MQDRLQQFLQAENLTPSQFADNLGVQRSGISHILAGRNKPGFEFIEKMLRRYPALNAEWLITGKGKMYKGELSPSLFDMPHTIPMVSTTPATPVAPESVTAPISPVIASAIPQEDATPSQIRPSQGTKSQIEQNATNSNITTSSIPSKQSVNVSKIIILYSDNTFVEYKPQ